MRALAVLAAIGLLFVAVVNLGIIVFGAWLVLSPPDINTYAFEPCCEEPDVAVAYGLVWWFGFVLAEGLILAAVTGLVAYATCARWPAWRRLAVVPAATVAVAAVSIAIPLLPLLDEGYKHLP